MAQDLRPNSWFNFDPPYLEAASPKAAARHRPQLKPPGSPSEGSRRNLAEELKAVALAGQQAMRE